MANRFSTGTNIIRMVRGDTHTFNISIEDETDADGIYRLNDNDTLYLGIMLPHQKFEDAIIRKKFLKADQDDYGNISVILVPEDTFELDPGIYYYAVKLQHGMTITTVITKTKFVIFD